MPDVVDNPAQSRLEIVEDAGIAVLEYRRLGTGSPSSTPACPRSSRARATAPRSCRPRSSSPATRTSHRPVLPLRPGWIEKHPEAVEGVTIDPID